MLPSRDITLTQDNTHSNLLATTLVTQKLFFFFFFCIHVYYPLVITVLRFPQTSSGHTRTSA